MTTKRKSAIFLTIIFVLSICLPLIFSDKQGGAVSTTENRVLAKFPSLTSVHGLRSGLENWINDNEGFRVQLQKLHADVDFNVFHTSPNSLVKFGKNGWYFYTGDNNLEIALDDYPLTQETLIKIKETQVAIQQALKKRGITYVIILTPSKVSVYPENLIGDFHVRQTVIDEVSNYLTKNTTIPVINLKNDLLKAKQSEIVYRKTDTHWNQMGAYYGYCAIINRLNSMGIIDSKPAKISTFSTTEKGEFSGMMGDVNLLPAEPIKGVKILNPASRLTHDKNLLDLVGQAQAGHNLNIDGCQFFHNSKDDNGKMLVYGDSFFGQWAMQTLLAENFTDLNFIWSDFIKNSVVTATKPNIVMMERTERYIYTLAYPVDPTLLFEPLKNPQAQIISDTTPTQIERGRNYDVNIVVKNTGTESWSEKQQIRLCIFRMERIGDIGLNYRTAWK